MKSSNKKLIITTFSLIILAEALSFVTYLYPAVNPWVFGLVALAALGLAVYKLEWGVYLIFAELAIGSFGKLFVLQISGVELSIRIVLWLIVISVWLARPKQERSGGLAQVVRTRRIAFLHSQFFKPYLALAVVLGWGIVWGLGRGHDFGVVFFDANNYLYFLLIFPVYDVLVQNRDAMYRVSTILFGAISWLAVKTILLFYIFSHELFGLQDILYSWSRRFQLAEITNINPMELTSRVFIQSQIWVLFGLFIILGYLFFCHSGAKPPKAAEAIESRISKYGWILSPRRMRGSRMTLILSIFLSSALIMSFSRSFWLAGILSLGVFLILLLIQRERFSRVFYFGILSIVIMTLGVGLTLGVAAFPIPRGSSSADFLKNRASQFKEAAASSRVSQIRPLLTMIAKHPAIGSGFGQAVTYQSQDPRVLKNHPDGQYTTTAFELGWLEIWLKLGLLGVLVYLYLLWQILKFGWQTGGYLAFGAMAGLVAVVITHGVSPYLNHPLGIGAVLLLTCAFDTSQRQE